MLPVGSWLICPWPSGLSSWQSYPPTATEEKLAAKQPHRLPPSSRAGGDRGTLPWNITKKRNPLGKILIRSNLSHAPRAKVLQPDDSVRLTCIILETIELHRNLLLVLSFSLLAPGSWLLALRFSPEYPNACCSGKNGEQRNVLLILARDSQLLARLANSMPL